MRHSCKESFRGKNETLLCTYFGEEECSLVRDLYRSRKPVLVLPAWKRRLPPRGELWSGLKMKVTNCNIKSKGCFLSCLRIFPGRKEDPTPSLQRKDLWSRKRNGESRWWWWRWDDQSPALEGDLSLEPWWQWLGGWEQQAEHNQEGTYAYLSSCTETPTGEEAKKRVWLEKSLLENDCVNISKNSAGNYYEGNLF